MSRVWGLRLMMSMRTSRQPKRKNRNRCGTRWTMISSVSETDTEQRTRESETVPDRESQGSDHEKCRTHSLCPFPTGRGEAIASESGDMVADATWTGATMLARVTVAAVAASEIREGLMLADFATFSSESSLRRNSEGRRLSAGTEARLRPEAVSLISTLPLRSSRL